MLLTPCLQDLHNAVQIKFRFLLQIIILGLIVEVWLDLLFLIRNFDFYMLLFLLLQKVLKPNLIILRKLRLCSCLSWQCLTNTFPSGLCQLCCYRTCWAWIHSAWVFFFWHVARSCRLQWWMKWLHSGSTF